MRHRAAILIDFGDFVLEQGERVDIDTLAGKVGRKAVGQLLDGGDITADAAGGDAGGGPDSPASPQQDRAELTERELLILRTVVRLRSDPDTLTRAGSVRTSAVEAAAHLDGVSAAERDRAEIIADAVAEALDAGAEAAD